MASTKVSGFCDARFDAVGKAFRENFDAGLETGAAFALSLDNRPVVDLWGGVARLSDESPWREDTVTPVSSSSKILVAICGLLLIDRGLIELDAPVADYWPEFAGGGKQGVRVRHIFAHLTGLPGLDGMPPWDVLADWDEVARRLEAQTPWWEPGTQAAYHAYTFGNLIGELVRRTTGRTLNRFFEDEIAGPFGIDFHFGLREQDRRRFAPSIQDGQTGIDEYLEEIDRTSDEWRVLGYSFTEDANLAFLRDHHGVCGLNVPAGNGVTNARALAKLGAIMASGGASSSARLMKPETAALPYQEQVYMFDTVMNAKVRYGVGFGMASDEVPVPWPNAFHWGGFGGSFCFMVPELGAAIAYTPSRFATADDHLLDQRGQALFDAAVACLAALPPPRVGH